VNLFEHAPDPARRGLTPRQREVLALVGEGFTNREIAEVLGISWRTVKRLVEQILDRLGVASRSRAIVVAVRAGEL
jgi:DNA-binding NarL/FixJ family response regulator